LRPVRGTTAGVGQSRGKLVSKMISSIDGADQGAQHADHVEDFRHAALIEGVNGYSLPDERGDDVGLKVREAQDEIGFEFDNLRDVRRGEGRDLRLFPARLGRADTIAGDANNAVLLAEKIEGLDGLLGQTDDALRREHHPPLQ
jgi:hypothetical protein